MTEGLLIQDLPVLKTCLKCHVEKSSAEFYKRKTSSDGLHSRCKVCESEEEKIRRKKNSSRETVILPDRKRCSGCGLEKGSDCFCKDIARGDGLNPYCRECSSKEMRAWSEKNIARDERSEERRVGKECRSR